MDDELIRLRAKIDEIDARLLAAFLERMRTAEAIGAWKAAHGLPVRDEEREAALISRVRNLVGPRDADAAAALYETLLRLSRDRQSYS